MNSVDDGVPHAVEPGAGLVDVLGAGGGVVVVGGVVEQDGVFAHEVVDGRGFVRRG